MSYPTLTNKQTSVLEVLAKMSQGECSNANHFSSQMVALEIYYSLTVNPCWDMKMKQNSLERAVAVVLGALQNKGLVNGFYYQYKGPPYSVFKKWALNLEAE
jgi:hypothetical protein